MVNLTSPACRNRSSPEGTTHVDRRQSDPRPPGWAEGSVVVAAEPEDAQEGQAAEEEHHGLEQNVARLGQQRSVCKEIVFVMSKCTSGRFQGFHRIQPELRPSSPSSARGQVRRG